MAASLASLRRFSVAHHDLIVLVRFSGSCRFCSNTASSDEPKHGSIAKVRRLLGLKQSPEDQVKRPGFVKRYLLDRVIGIITDSSNRLEQTFPTVFQIYKTFKTGLVGFIKDSREYYNISTDLWSGTSLKDLSRHQLEILRSVPRDFVRILPVLFLGFVPGGSAAFPLAYVFPRLLLSQHFWTEQQRHEFWQKDLKSCLEHLQPTLDHMNLVSMHLDDIADEMKVINITKKLRHSVHPTVTEVLELRPLFEKSLYNLERLSITYMRHLAKSMRMSLRRRQLRHDAMLLHYTDMAMLREGLDIMTDFELERACFWRGLNPVHLSRNERIIYLRHWTDVSKHIDEHCVSLLLHLPLFFGFWQPTNRELMGGWRYRLRIHRKTDS